MAEGDGKVRLVILDWAGTTVDYGCYAPTVVFVEVFRLKGVDISVAQARAPMGRAKREHIKAISQQPEVAEMWRAKHGKDCSDADVDDMFEQHFRPLQIECIARYAGLIPGTLDAVAALRAKDMLIGTTTGYFTEAAEINRQEAERQGFAPDTMVCASDVPAGRPEPWMVMRNMELTGVFPPSVVVKVGDTLPDIGEGRNAGTWTVGLSKTGNEIGLNEEELNALPDSEVNGRIAKAKRALYDAGAHFVVECIVDVPGVVDEIEQRLQKGERP
jgi:phosphonoacetaldehyde hydrolase